MPIFSRLIFYVVRWSARRGLRDSPVEPSPRKQDPDVRCDEKFERKEKARRRRLLGETYVCWYLRKQGYIFIAKNYMPQGAKGELDLVGYDGETIAFVEIRTRIVHNGSISGLPELSVGYAKQTMLVRTAQRFLVDRHLHDCPTRFDVLAIDNISGHRRKSDCTKTPSARNCVVTDNFLGFCCPKWRYHPQRKLLRILSVPGHKSGTI